ncbi:unnamed protein product [Caenorhabditis sp. 36 PRJEB53466]|nr:unnamed protein product [Caenorhabditis sp. 36 PRJEB53466]
MKPMLDKKFGIPLALLLNIQNVAQMIGIVLIAVVRVKLRFPPLKVISIALILSSIAMLFLAAPEWVNFETPQCESLQGRNASSANSTLSQWAEKSCVLEKKRAFHDQLICNIHDRRNSSSPKLSSWEERQTNIYALVLFGIGQCLAGFSSAPFITIAFYHVYEECSKRKEEENQPSLLLGILTAIYLTGPYISQPFIESIPWLQKSWIGFCVCGGVYALTAIFMFFLSTKNESLTEKTAQTETLMLSSQSEHLENTPVTEKGLLSCCLRELWTNLELCSKRKFLTMSSAWTLNTYIFTEYQQHLSEFIRIEYGTPHEMAVIYTGVHSFFSIALPLVIGGCAMSRLGSFSTGKLKSTVKWMGIFWFIICLAFTAVIFCGCPEPTIEDTNTEGNASSCLASCDCDSVTQIYPVNFNGKNFRTPCHAGCIDFDPFSNIWSNCKCVGYSSISTGLAYSNCKNLVLYLVITGVGLFVGNLVFITPMMTILKDAPVKKGLFALCLATSLGQLLHILGFITSLIFPAPIKLTCILMSNGHSEDDENCVLQDNLWFTSLFHGVPVGFQVLALYLVYLYYISPSEQEDIPMTERNRELSD